MQIIRWLLQVSLLPLQSKKIGSYMIQLKLQCTVL